MLENILGNVANFLTIVATLIYLGNVPRIRKSIKALGNDGQAPKDDSDNKVATQDNNKSDTVVSIE